MGPDGSRLSLASVDVLGVATALEQEICCSISHAVAGARRADSRRPCRPVLGLCWWSWHGSSVCGGHSFRRSPWAARRTCSTQLTTAYDTEAEVIGRETTLLPEEETLLQRHLAPGRRLLDIGCGAGREAIAFARAGLAVTGIDVAPAMIALARDRARAAGLAIEFAVGEALTWPVTGGPFDAIYFSPGSTPTSPAATVACARSRGCAISWRPAE